jgi:multidrug transporter EmrE-like cation transporter
MNYSNKFLAVGLVILCSFITAAAQILLKLSTKNIDSFYQIITNIPLILGLILYFTASMLLILALKHGDVSLLYPFVALSFIWTTVLAMIIFNETVSYINMTGILLIIVGVSFIGAGIKK